jgi:hypothetical protein
LSGFRRSRRTTKDFLGGAVSVIDEEIDADCANVVVVVIRVKFPVLSNRVTFPASWISGKVSVTVVMPGGVN